MLVNRTMGGGLNAGLSFFLPLGDAGAGAVNTTPANASGSPTATFTRATTAWTKLASGLWASVASGTARSCYLGQSTAVGAYGGYFAEGAATQLVTPTASIRDMSDASWAKVTMTAAKTSTGIDGVATSCSRLTASGASATILQTLVAAATTRTYSCFIKRITGTGEIDISEDGTTWTDITSQINSSTFTRVSITVSQLNAAFGLRIVTNGDAIDVDFNQFESGSFASSPMDAAGAARNADVLTYTSSGNASVVAGTAYFETQSTNATALTESQLDINDGSTNNRVLFRKTTAPGARLDIASGGVAQAAEVAGTPVAGVIGKYAGVWNTNYGKIAFGGTLSTGDLVVTVPVSFTTITVGQDQAAGQPLFGTIRNLRIWTRQLADSQITSLTQ